MDAAYPLVNRELNSAFAFLARPIPNFGLAAGYVDVKTFLHHVALVAGQLPDSPHVINMCANRYLFVVTFCATIVEGKTNLLPANKNKVTQCELADNYGGCCVVHDGAEVDSSLHSVNVATLQFNLTAAAMNDAASSIPTIVDSHLACISFTSGSTGRSKPNLKYWRTLRESSAINFRHMLGEIDRTLFQLATMPAQHMWGLETSVLLPMFFDVCLCDAQPLFPQDIVDILHQLPEPKMLVSTPVHLRALLSAKPEAIKLRTVLCATSPLTNELANQVESTFTCELREVYGCSEVGSMAVRRTAKESCWRRFDGIDFTAKGEVTWASADHLPETIELQDQINAVDEDHFELCGRTSDLIKIAGKRGSLFAINQTLLKFDGLQDGIVIKSDRASETARPCAIVALQATSSKAALLAYLRDHLDSAFVPRPIYVVDELPRESNGKLVKAKLAELLEQLRG
ncbi:AMP-binding protein [Alteromonas flava]|uniref:AMP-binding protein n=1 Tax=Alteromonas flava TaxID=2048003 RepID=UPI000C28F018|nr:AMP-binding protein [Alteromonas flava]